MTVLRNLCPHCRSLTELLQPQTRSLCTAACWVWGLVLGLLQRAPWSAGHLLYSPTMSHWDPCRDKEDMRLLMTWPTNALRPCLCYWTSGQRICLLAPRPTDTI